MDITAHRRERLRKATENACSAFTKGMSKAQLQSRLDDVKAMLKGSTDRDGRPMKGMGERVHAIKTEIARLEKLTS